MARKKFQGDGDQQVKQAIDWYATTDSTAEGVADWDIKTDKYAEAILKVLASGCAIMFGTTMDGGAVSVTIFQDEKKSRKYLTDSVELDDWADNILKVYWARQKRNSPQPPGAEQGEALASK